jgi:Tfp pilus assembly protein PilO
MLGGLNAQLSATEALFLRDQKPTLAAANLQGLIHKLGEETGLTIVRENVLAPKEMESFVEVPIELSLRGEKKALRDFLFRVQTAPYLLTLPKLIIKEGRSHTNRVMTAEMQVVGYIQAEERK